VLYQAYSSKVSTLVRVGLQWHRAVAQKPRVASYSKILHAYNN